MTNLRLTLLGALASGLMAAALVPAAVASADQFDLQPDPGIPLAPTQVEGYPPLVNIVTGTDDWVFHDITANTNPIGILLAGTDTHTTFGSLTNDDFLSTTGSTITVQGVSDPTAIVVLQAGDQYDLANFGGGFENEWVDIASGPNAGVSDLLITPFGDFQTIGTFFSELTGAFAS